MVRIVLLILLALFNTTSAFAGTSPRNHVIAATLKTEESAKTEEKSNTGPWIAAGAFAAFVFLMVIKNIFWPAETRPLTPEEAKQAQERLLDNYSKLRMWQAVARHDGDALREEMKLMELRNLRRLNE